VCGDVGWIGHDSCSGGEPPGGWRTAWRHRVAKILCYLERGFPGPIANVVVRGRSERGDAICDLQRELQPHNL